MRKKVFWSRLFSVILCVCMVMSVLSVGAFAVDTASGTCGEDLYWALDDEGTLTISGTGKMSNYTWSSDVPWYSMAGSVAKVVISQGVTSIGGRAFYGCSNLSSVVIPNGVTIIGDYAFYGCVSLSSVVFPESMTGIGKYAFNGCSSLRSVEIPKNVTGIGDGAFAWCSSLSSAVISKGVTGIGDYAFYSCGSLSSIVIPESVAGIGDSAFECCSKLTSVVISEGVTNIGEYAFSECGSLSSVEIPESMTGIGVYAFNECTSLSSVVIPKNVTSIGEFTFFDCSSLNSVEISEGVTGIGDSAFSGCYSLTSVVIPESVTSIGYGAFSSCDDLTEIVVDENNAYYSSDAAGVLYNKEKTELIQAPGKISGHFSIPEGVTDIGDMAFYNCYSLTGVVIPEGVTSIGDMAFAVCYSMSSVAIPKSVTAIGDSAFSSCGSLSDVNYSGSEEQWNAISIGSDCEDLRLATVHYFGCVHKYSVVTTPPTCTEQGYETHTCTICGDSFQDHYTYAEHSKGEEGVVTAPTCTEQGYTTYSCTVCGDSLEDDYVDALGHTPGESVVTDPTCTASGYTTYICTVCNHSYTGDYVEAIGHSFAEDGTCGTCGISAKKVIMIDMTDSRGDSWNGCALQVYEDGVLIATATIADGSKAIWTGNYDETKAYKICWKKGSWAGECSFEITIAGEVVLTATEDDCAGYSEGYCLYLSCQHQYEVTVTPPTCTEQGYSTHTCSICGQSFTDSIVPATGFTLAGANTVLGGVLDMNFFINPSDLSGADYYAEITLYTKDNTVTTTVPYDQWDVRPNYLVVTQKGLAARQMADKIEVVIYNGDGSQASFMWSDSIRGYVMRILEKQDAETKTMLVDMLNYGAAAQDFFTYNTDDLANSQLTEAQKEYGSQSVDCMDNREQGENYFGSSLVLKDRILMTMYFKNITTDMYAIVSFTDHKNGTHEIRVEGSEFAKYNDTTYGVTVDDLVVADGDQLVTITVYDADGNSVASGSDSINSYAARQLGKHPLYEMVAKFTASAYTYLH